MPRTNGPKRKIFKSPQELRSALNSLLFEDASQFHRWKGTYSHGSINLMLRDIHRDYTGSNVPVTLSFPLDKTGIPAGYLDSALKRNCVADFLLRQFNVEVQNKIRGNSLISVYKPGQSIIPRSSLYFDDECVNCIVQIHPGSGENKTDTLYTILCEDIPAIMESVFTFDPYLEKKLGKHIAVAEDAEYLRHALNDLGLVAFIGDDSRLPRMSQFDDRPVVLDRVVPVKAPESLEVTVQLPHSGDLSGIGIRRGISLVIGGGYHGKSTFVEALQQGGYNHIPGDGRNFAVTVPETMRVNSERGRYVSCVNISPFVGKLPYFIDNEHFSTQNASGSTSQAASIMEALELGTKLLIFDEDSCATNLLIRDMKMQEMVAKHKEPLTPLIDKVKWLFKEKGVSTILALGGSGDYFEVADTVILMDEYQPKDVTRDAKNIVLMHRESRLWEGPSEFGPVMERVPVPESVLKVFGPQKTVPDTAITGSRLRINDTTVDLSHLEQFSESGQIMGSVFSILYCRDYLLDGKRTLKNIMRMLFRRLDKHGLPVINPQGRNDLAMPRPYEVAALLNRTPGILFREK